MAEYSSIISTNTLKFDYLVEFPVPTIFLHAEHLRFLEENERTGYFSVLHTGWSVQYRFTDAKTAVVFKLRFG